MNDFSLYNIYHIFQMIDELKQSTVPEDALIRKHVCDNNNGKFDLVIAISLGIFLADYLANYIKNEVF